MCGSDTRTISLSIFALNILLLRCQRWQHICSGSKGLVKHQTSNQRCLLLDPALPTSPSLGSTQSLAFSDDDSVPPSQYCQRRRTRGALWPWTFHRSSRLGGAFFLVVERLLGIINLNRSSSAECASLAFNILPGLVGAYFLSRKMPIADFLNGLLRYPAFVDDRGFPDRILAVARAHASTLLVQRG